MKPHDTEPVDEQPIDELESLKAEVASLKDQLLRRAADFENMRKRTARERVQLFEDAKVNALRGFLPVLDDMVRMVQASEGQDIPPAFLEGVKLVADKFQTAINSYGLERIDQTGVAFDVNLHEALLRQPAPDAETPANTVLMVLDPGYRLGDRVIRHAKVVVSE